MPTLICDCNRTLPLQPQALGLALNETLTLHSALCRREVGAFQNALASSDDVLVACTQEKRLFTEVAQQTPGHSAVVKFVNIRETGGWSRDGGQAGPKIAALLAAAHLPAPEPVPTVSYHSAGRLLIIGPLALAESVAALLGDALNVTIFAQASAAPSPLSLDAPPQARHYPVIAGDQLSIQGWLGAFAATWQQTNPIDLDLCTRCNACLLACPESAIDLSYQIDSKLCKDHRDCVAVCQVAGAIDFARPAQLQQDPFDLVLDLGETPLLALHAPPQGYFHVAASAGLASAGLLPTLLKLRDLVGEFEKPKFFTYQQKLCAHSRNQTVGCQACIDVCSAQAISSDKKQQQIVVNPQLCVGCGACTTVCPSGALRYSYPRAPEQGLHFKTLLSTYLQAGGKQPVLLLHNQGKGQTQIEALGRAARLDKTVHGLPANVIPHALWHNASVGAELWLSALAFGASQVAVLLTDEDAPAYKQALQTQMQVVQTVLNGLGYAGVHLHLIEAQSSASGLALLDAQLQALAHHSPQVPAVAARFAVPAEKRSALDLALEHLMTQAPASLPEAIALPATGSPWGTVQVDTQACTLCLSCVSACPASALLDNAQKPQLQFIEKNCVQCGLCATTCPEDAITLQPRLLLTGERKQARVLHETQPYHCIRCAKPFGTLQAIEAMLGRLAGHTMFQGAAAERLKMCSDCRVIDIYSAENESKITDIR